MQLHYFRRAPGRRVTKKSQLFHTNRRSGRDWGSTQATCVAGSGNNRSAIHYDPSGAGQGSNPGRLCAQSGANHLAIHYKLKLQGYSKVLDTFVLPIYSMSYGALKKYYCQIKAEILKFM
jgi:hypothetical protein